MPRDAFALKIQRELCHPKYARKVSALSRNRPLETILTATVWRRHQQLEVAPFCSERKIDLIQPSVGARVDFLAMLYEKGLSYSSINTARCALSAILDPDGASCTTFGQHPDIKRFMKSTFQCRPTLPRNSKTCNVNIVLQHIISMDDSNNLPLKDVTMKLAMLVSLTTAQRRQSLHLMDTEGMVAEK